MKTKFMILIAALGLATATSGRSDLMITGIIDGPRTGGLPKAIELYAINDIADLSTWNVQNYNNGGATATNTLNLNGSVNAGDYIYVASESTEFNAFFGFAPTFIGSAVNVNGNDAVVLRNNTTIVDAFGVIGENPGVDTTWNYQDAWFYRVNESLATPNWTASNWFFVTGQSDGLDSLGTSGTNTTNTSLSMPVGTYAIPEPSSIILMSLVGLAAVVILRKRK